MHLAVKHNLQVYASDVGQPGDPAGIVLPMREAEVAVMGETIAGFLSRVAWRFDLPTIYLINGDCYGRAEWATSHLAVNDNVEFVSRPLVGGGGGSTVKSIASVVALIALTAVAPQLGALGAGALLSGGGTAVGTLSSLTTADILRRVQRSRKRGSRFSQPRPTGRAPSRPIGLVIIYLAHHGQSVVKPSRSDEG